MPLLDASHHLRRGTKSDLPTNVENVCECMMLSRVGYVNHLKCCYNSQRQVNYANLLHRPADNICRSSSGLRTHMVVLSCSACRSNQPKQGCKVYLYAFWYLWNRMLVSSHLRVHRCLVNNLDAPKFYNQGCAAFESVKALIVMGLNQTISIHLSKLFLFKFFKYTINFVEVRVGCNWLTLWQKWLMNYVFDRWLHGSHDLFVGIQRWFWSMFWRLVSILPQPCSFTVFRNYPFLIASNNSMPNKG